MTRHVTMVALHGSVVFVTVFLTLESVKAGYLTFFDGKTFIQTIAHDPDGDSSGETVVIESTTPDPVQESTPPPPDPVQESPPPPPDPIQESSSPTTDPVPATPPPPPEPVQETAPPTPEPAQESDPPSPDPIKESPPPSSEPVQESPAPVSKAVRKRSRSHKPARIASFKTSANPSKEPPTPGFYEGPNGFRIKKYSKDSTSEGVVQDYLVFFSHNSGVVHIPFPYYADDYVPMVKRYANTWFTVCGVVHYDVRNKNKAMKKHATNSKKCQVLVIEGNSVSTSDICYSDTLDKINCEETPRKEFETMAPWKVVEGSSLTDLNPSNRAQAKLVDGGPPPGTRLKTGEVYEGPNGLKMARLWQEWTGDSCVQVYRLTMHDKYHIPIRDTCFIDALEPADKRDGNDYTICGLLYYSSDKVWTKVMNDGKEVCQYMERHGGNISTNRHDGEEEECEEIKDKIDCEDMEDNGSKK